MNNIEKSNLIMNFVGEMTGAYASNFVETPILNIGQLYQVARNHVKDNYGTETKSLAEEMGEDFANDCNQKPAENIFTEFKVAQWVCEDKLNPWPNGGGHRFDSENKAKIYLTTELGKHYNNVKAIYIAIENADIKTRSPKDYAIEHAEYMAKAAEHYMNTMNEALTEDTDLGDNPESISEAWNNLKSMIFEFRKRAVRA